MKAKIILGIVTAALCVVILIQNTQVVTFRVFFWRISISQIILVPIVFLVGLLLGYLFAKVKIKGKKNELSS